MCQSNLRTEIRRIEGICGTAKFVKAFSFSNECFNPVLSSPEGLEVPPYCMLKGNIPGDDGMEEPEKAFFFRGSVQLTHLLTHHSSKARSRLYQRRFWPPNHQFSAFFEIYTICTLLHRSELKILEKIIQNFQKFVNFF